MSEMKKNFALSVFIFGIIMASHASAYEGTLIKFDLKVGSGKEAIAGNKVNVHYTGWLFDKSAPRECSELPRFVSLKRVHSCLENKEKSLIVPVIVRATSNLN